MYYHWCAVKVILTYVHTFKDMSLILTTVSLANTIIITLFGTDLIT